MRRGTWIRTFTNRFPLVGPIVWILAIEYYAMQVVVAEAWPAPHTYSIWRNAISDLGATSCGVYSERFVCSPKHGLMNAAFIILGAVMITGSLLIYQEFRHRKRASIGFVFMAVAGLGSAVVGLSPENVNLPVHAIGAAGPFLLGNIALLIFSSRLDLPPPARRYTLISGIVGLTALVLFIAGSSLGLTWAYLGLGEGGMERLTSYPQTFWLIFFGIYMSRNHYMKRQRQGPTTGQSTA